MFQQKIFCNQIVPLLRFKEKQRYILQEEFNISIRELSSLVDSLRDFLKASDQASKCIQN